MSTDLFRLLDVDPARCKGHFASWGQGAVDPLDAYRRGEIDLYQNWQPTRVTLDNRPLMITLVQLPERNHWLLEGVYEVPAPTLVTGRPAVCGHRFDADTKWKHYDLQRVAGLAHLEG